MSEGAYWAVLTAPILESREICDGAKLFYAQVALRTGRTGYCWASNRALSEELGLGERTVSRYVAELEAAGFIACEVTGVSDRKRRRERRIRLAEPAPFNLAKSGDIKVAKNGEFNLAKNGDHIIGRSNKSKNNPPKAPTGGEEERFEKFWRTYRDVYCAADHSRAGDKAKARKAWSKLQLDDALAAKLWAYLKAQMQTDLHRRGFGIQYASTFLNAVARNEIDLTPVDASPAASAAFSQRAAPEEPQEEAFGVWH